MRHARSSTACARSSPAITGPRTDDICYATTNRQAAVKQMAAHCDLVLVIGSRNSSNSVRLVEVARDYGAEAHLIDNEGQVQEELARGQARRRHLLRRERARGARPAPGRRSSATAAPRTSPSSRSSRRTCASCCPKKIRRDPAAQPPEPRPPSAQDRSRGGDPIDHLDLVVTPLARASASRWACSSRWATSTPGELEGERGSGVLYLSRHGGGGFGPPSPRESANHRSSDAVLRPL